MKAGCLERCQPGSVALQGERKIIGFVLDKFLLPFVHLLRDSSHSPLTRIAFPGGHAHERDVSNSCKFLFIPAYIRLADSRI